MISLLEMGRDDQRDEQALYGIKRTDAWVIVVFTSAGLFSMLFVLIATTVQPLLRQPPGRFVRARTAFTFLHSAILLSYAIWVIVLRTAEGEGNQRRACCNDKGHCILDGHLLTATASDTLETGCMLWQLVMALDILGIIRDPFKPDRHFKK